MPTVITVINLAEAFITRAVTSNFDLINYIKQIKLIKNQIDHDKLKKLSEQIKTQFNNNKDGHK